MKGGVVTGGAMDARVRIERATETLSDTGAVVKTWATLATVWAGVRYMRGREIEAASQVFDGADVMITIRAGGEGGKAHESDRVVRVADGEVFEVRGVMPVPGNRPQHYEIYSTVRRDKVAAA